MPQVAEFEFLPETIATRRSSWGMAAIATVAAVGVVAHPAMESFSSEYMALVHAGYSDGVALGAAGIMAGTEIAVVAGGVAAGIHVAADRIINSAKTVPLKAREVARSLRDFFGSHGITPGHRKMVISNQGVFADALVTALSASGTPHHLVSGVKTIMVAADARDMDPVVDALLSLPTFSGQTVTVISVRPNGARAPSAFVNLRDGTSAALWADETGRPTTTVGFGRDGKPSWIFRHSGGSLENFPEALADLPSRAASMHKMVEACEAGARAYETARDKMIAAAERGGHTLSEENGILTLRNEDGKLASAGDAPAILEPNGTETFAVNGLRVSRESMEDLLAMSGRSMTR